MTQLPPLTPDQRAAALERADELRAARDAITTGLRAGDRSLAELLDRADGDDVVGKMAVRDLVVARLGVAPPKAEALLEELGIPARRRARLLGDDEQRALIDAVEEQARLRPAAGVRAGAEDDLAALRAAFDGMELNPPAGWDHVHAFEATHGIVLPEPYRSFVAVVADGCADGPPGYGLIKLGDSPDSYGHHWQFATATGALARPFPLTEGWVWEDGDPPPVPGVTKDMVYDDGVLPLGTEGDGEVWALIVTGGHRGQIWNLTDVGASPFGQPFDGTSAAPGFAGWVAHWAEGNDWYDAM